VFLQIPSLDDLNIYSIETNKYFSKKELSCHCGCGFYNFSPVFLRKLTKARIKAGIPFVISSGCRCKAYNKIVGGVENSAHTKGLAVDIAIPNSSNRFTIIKALFYVGFNRIGIASNFIHVDDDFSKPQNVIWLY